MNLKTKIRIESKDVSAINLLMTHIKNEFLSRAFILKNSIVELTDCSIEETKDGLYYIELNCSGRFNKVLIPTLVDKHTLGIESTEFDLITIHIYPEDEDKNGDIGNMVYEQFVGHQDYIDSAVVLNTDEGIHSFICEDSSKFPLFILTKFYTAFDK